MIKALINEYGFRWLVYRFLYVIKLKILKWIPPIERLFEKKVQIKRIDLYCVDTIELEKFLQKLPEKERSVIISTAEKAIKGVITCFSSLELDYGYPINWHYNPITKKEVNKLMKWYEIYDFDPVRGDIKVIWEASRFTHFFCFIRAYLITKDKKYYNAFSEQLDNWIAENKYSYGVNYKCGQEATLRMINILIAYSIFKAYGLTNQKDEKNVTELVEGSYKKVLSNFFYAHKCIKNNHTLSEITGLIIGAWCCDNNKRLDKAYRLLDKEIKNQFFSDGGYVQYSFNYQRFALQIMEFVLKISDKTNRNISKNSIELLKKSTMLMYQMQDEKGDVPNYGSNDGALIFPVTSCNCRDFRPVINAVNVLLDGVRLYKPGKYDEELLWFTNKSIEDISIINTERIASKFEKSGFYSIRNKKGFLMTILQNYQTRPAQMDQLHIDIWHNGKNIFCDSGTYSYAEDIGKKMDLTSAHNTAKIDNKEQMKKKEPFLVYDWTSAIGIEHGKNYFSGTMISKNGYQHTRRIDFKESNYFIHDTVMGDGIQCEFNLHTPYEVKIVKNEVEVYDNGILLAKIKTAEDIKIEKAYRSLYYFQKDEITKISIIKKITNRNCDISFEIILFD